MVARLFDAPSAQIIKMCGRKRLLDYYLSAVKKTKPKQTFCYVLEKAIQNIELSSSCFFQALEKGNTDLWW